tara:strand:- start:657 stop:1937 length:1281 start_codon:yes stop_codon:yes gene_type:complete
MKRRNSLYVALFIILISFIITEEKTSVEIKEEIKLKKNKEEIIREEIETLKEKIRKNDIKSEEKGNKLKSIDKQIKLAEQLLKKIKEREQTINSSIGSTEMNIREKEQTMDNIRKQYSDMIIYLYKTHNNGYLDILLNSNNWNDIVYKMKYLEIISEREKEIKDNLNSSIVSLNEEIIKFVDDLSIATNEKTDKRDEVYSLNQDKEKEENEIDRTKRKKEQLKKEQFRKEKALKEIKELLEKLYVDKNLAEKREEEIKRKREEELKRIKEEEERKKKIINQKFANNKGKLSWPVKGMITEKQGKYTNVHDDGSYVERENKWIKIQTKKNSEVKLPFDGIISSMDLIDLYRGVIIVDHGDQYYTVYANLDEDFPESLNVGEYYYKDTLIGNVSDSEDEKHGELNFGIWKFSKNNMDPDYLNPEDWIK